jgi:hypothetical protein
MEPSRPQKKRLRAVLLISAVGGVACGNLSANESPPHRSESGDGDGDGDMVTPPVEPTPEYIGLPPEDERGSGGAPNNQGGAGGENLGWVVGIPK